MRSLRIKILGLAALLVLLTQIGTIGAVLYATNQNVEARARHMLKRAAGVSAQLFQARAQRLQNVGRLLAVSDALQDAIASTVGGDIQALVDASQQQAEVDLIMILGTNGEILAASKAIVPERHSIPALVGDATGASTLRTLMHTDGQVLEMVSVPIRTRTGDAWVSTGLQINQQLAERTSALTGLDITLIENVERSK